MLRSKMAAAPGRRLLTETNPGIWEKPARQELGARIRATLYAVSQASRSPSASGMLILFQVLNPQASILNLQSLPL